MPLQLRAKQSGDSRTQVQRYIRLTALIPPILQMVDEGQTALIPAVELSFSQAQRMKKVKPDGEA